MNKRWLVNHLSKDNRDWADNRKMPTEEIRKGFRKIPQLINIARRGIRNSGHIPASKQKDNTETCNNVIIFIVVMVINRIWLLLGIRFLSNLLYLYSVFYCYPVRIPERILRIGQCVTSTLLNLDPATHTIDTMDYLRGKDLLHCYKYYRDFRT